jgi:hypothetical protein
MSPLFKIVVALLASVPGEKDADSKNVKIDYSAVSKRLEGGR